MNNTRTQILCPLCRTNPVGAPSWSFADTSVEVPVCGDHGAAVSARVKVSAIADLYVPESAWQHTDGLVTF